MKPTLKRTLLTVETVLEHFRTNRHIASYYCNLHTDCESQHENGDWNRSPPTEAQMLQAALWYVENHYGVEGRIPTDLELDKINSGEIRLV